MKKAVIEALSLSKSFTQGTLSIPVLHTITLRLMQGQSYAITGVSGVGKSTLLHLLAGLEVPTEGSVTYNGQALSAMSDAQKEQWLHSAIGIVFQQPYLIAELTIAQNIALKALIQGKTYARVEPWIDQLLDMCGLYDKKEAYPRMLSGGQQQRVALARALCTKPTFLFADEPTGNLDEATGRSLIDLIVQFKEEWQMGVIICSHDAYVTRSLQTIYCIRNGRLVVEKE